MEIRIVVSEPYAAEFSAGGGFVPSNKMEASPVAGDAPLGSSTTTGYAAIFPSTCVAEAIDKVPGGSRMKRTRFCATFLPDHEAQAAGLPPRRLCVVVGRDPASSNAVVRHNLAQGPLLSRRHCALRTWFPRALCHPSIGIRSSTDRHKVIFAMDCVDFGSMNGTFVDHRRISPTSLPCKPILVDAEALFASRAPDGVHVATLSFGTGSKLPEGGALQASQERLRFDVFVRIPAQHVPHQGAITLLPTCGEELVAMLFKDTLPVTEIDMPRSSLAAASRATLKEGYDEAMDYDAASMTTSRSAVTMADSPTRKSRTTILADVAKSSGPLLSPPTSSHTAPLLGGGTSLNKLHSRHSTDDVLSGILKDHGYGSSSSRKMMEEAKLDNPRRGLVADDDGCSAVEPTSAVIRCHFQGDAADGVVELSPIPERLASDGAMAAVAATCVVEHAVVDEQEVNCAMIVSRRGGAPQVRCASSGPVAPILLESGDMSQTGRRSSTGDHVCQRRQGNLPNELLLSSMPTSQLSEALPSDEVTVADKHVELLDSPADMGHQLLPKKKTTPTNTDGAADGKKKGGRPKRVTDPTETLSRFCEALRADQPTIEQPKKCDHKDTHRDDGHAMAKSLKASLSFVQEMKRHSNNEVGNGGNPPAPTNMNVVQCVDDEEDDDIPLGMLLMRDGGGHGHSSSHSVIVAESHHELISVPGTDATSIATHSLPIPPSDNTADGKLEGQLPTVVMPAAGGVHRESWYQLDDFIASQVSGDLNVLDESDCEEMAHPGGCVMVAGRTTNSEALPAVDRHTTSQSKQQRNETLRCLFDEEGCDESSDSHHYHGTNGGSGRPHGEVERRYFESLSRAIGSLPTKNQHLNSSQNILDASNRRVHPMSAVLGGGSVAEEAAATRVLPDGLPARLQAATSFDGQRSSSGHADISDGDATKAIAGVTSPTGNVVSTFSSDGSCATWRSSPQELTLIASQVPLLNKGRGDVSTQPFQSQIEITRNPVRRYALGNVLQQLDTSSTKQHHHADNIALREEAATKPRRVSFNPAVSTVDLPPAAAEHVHKSARTSPPKRTRAPSAAELRRSKLEAVLNVLPSALAEHDAPENDATASDNEQLKASNDGHRRHAFIGWSRTLSHLAEDPDVGGGDNFDDASTRVVHAPQSANGEVDIAVYASAKLRAVLKPHQWDALQFMWRCLMLDASPADVSNTKGKSAKVRPRNEAIVTAAMKSSLKRARHDERTSDETPRTSAKTSGGGDGDGTFGQRASTHFDFSWEGDGSSSRSKEEKEVLQRPRGCVLAHAMGLGKSFTVIGFLFTLWRHISDHGFSRLSSSPAWSGAPWLRSLLRTGGGARVVVCVPKALAFHWVREVHQWSVAMDEEAVTIFLLSQDTRSDKLSLLQEWAAEGSQGRPGDAAVGEDEPASSGCNVSFPRSILLVTHSTLTSMMMSVEDFETPTGGSKGKPKRSLKKKKNQDDEDGFWYEEDEGAQEEEEVFDERSAQRRAARLEHLKKCRAVLLSMTNCLIVDEVHRIQNPTSRLARSLCQFRSSNVMKVALTGTPVTSNSRDELLAILQFVMPSLWTKRDLSDRALIAEMTRFVHRRGMETLAAELPNIVEHTIVVRMSPTQGELFRNLIQHEQEHGVVPPRKLLETVSRTMLISNHTDLVADWCRRKGVATSQQAGIPNDARWAAPALDVPSIFDDPPWREGLDHEVTEPLSAHPAAESLEHSWKMRTLLALLQRALSCGEKVVVFSHSVKTLYLVGRLLSILFDLHDAEEFALLDGRIPSAARDDLTARFNDPAGSLSLLLLSFQSNSIGHNFTGAQRVILFEVSWRPVIDLQAICRVFRFGQRHTVFVNRLVSLNGIEERMLSQLQATSNPSSAATASRKKTGPATRTKVPSERGGATNGVPISTPVGAEELLRSLLTTDRRSTAGRFIDTEGSDPVLTDVVASASSIAHVIRDRSFSAP